MRRRLAASIARVLVTMLVAGFLGASLVRFAPGYGFDPNALDSRLSSESRAALQQHQPQTNVVRFYAIYLRALARGDWGTSISLHQPVRDLVKERLPVTLKGMGIAMVVAWTLALVLAGLVESLQWRPLEMLSTAGNAAVLSAPAAVLALLCLLLQWPAVVAITALVFAYLFSFTLNIFRDHYARPHVLSAVSRGASKARVLFVHVLSSAAPELFALLGLTVATAFAAALPVEVLADVPGIGQLAWQAALARDLSLVVTLTLVVTLLTVTASAAADVLSRSARGERA